ncbi:hypothetical protein GZH49_02935 [Nocardia terpenica]|uniref:hypothetical protein n=1 Tax=Nocardia terpenica TaxID=455432 RepID=UPI002FE1C6C6
MVVVGDHVRLVPGGVSIFEVVEVVDDEHAIVIAADTASPGRYPFEAQIRYLVLADR